MGWTCTEKPFNVKEYFDNMHVSTDPMVSMRVLKSGLKNFKEYYAAVEITYLETNETKVLCSVVICDFYNDCGIPMISYKEMTDSCGPRVDNCPESILDLLTDTDCKFAVMWRMDCRSKIAMRKNLSAQLKHGNKVTFSTPIKFTDGTTHSELYVWKGQRKVRFATYPTADVGTSIWDMPSYRINKSVLASKLVFE